MDMKRAAEVLRFGVLIIIVLCLLDSGNAQTSAVSLFQCQPSSEQNGQVFIPNIPDLYFDHRNAADFRTSDGANLTTRSDERGTTFIFTVPPLSDLRDCTGTVVSLQYCYQARDSNNIGQDRATFNFLSLNRDDFEFTVTDIIRVRAAPRDDICTDPPGGPGEIQRICCDITTLDEDDQFRISSSNYTFGVVVPDNQVIPLAFSDSTADYRFEQLVARPSGDDAGPTNNSTFTLAESDLQNGLSLPLLRYFIVPDPISTTEETTTATVTTAEDDNSTVTSTSQPPSMPQTTARVVNTVNDGLIGGIVAGIIAFVLLVAVVVITLCLIVAAKRRKKHYITKDGQDGNTYTNALYEDTASALSNGGNQRSTKAAPVPVIYSEVKKKKKKKKTTTTLPLDNDNERSYDKLHHAIPGKSQGEDEEIYEVPAKDETALYSQLDKIQTPQLSRNSIRLGEYLGSGQFGTVYKGVLVSAGGEVEVAVKTLNEGSGEEKRVKFLQEAAIMGQFKHPNVVKLYGVVTNGEPILIVLDLLVQGDLRKHLLSLKEGVSVDDHTLLSYCRQVASGMTYLSNKAFVHRDLAARNILVSEDETCKVADFGMSRDLMDEDYYVSHGGKVPVKWTAPEALHYKKYSTASDVWSYGALMYEIWSLGHKPYENFTNSQVVPLIDTGFRLSPPPGCPRAIYTIMISCWHPNISQRPDFSEIAIQLSLPDTRLLKWSEEDKSVHPEAAKLGADLLCGEDLYTDLQTKYKTEDSAVGLYESVEEHFH